MKAPGTAAWAAIATAAATLLGTGVSLAADAGAAPATAAQVLGAAPGVVETVLQRPVSMEAVRKPLAEVVAELSNQSQVALKVDAAMEVGSRRVTMRVRALPLSEVLNSLVHLYGGQWRKSGEASFLWQPSEDPIALPARRSGGFAGPTFEIDLRESSRQTGEIAGQIYNAADAAQWRAREGVPLLDLDADAQALLMRQKQQGSAPALARAYTLWKRVMASEPTLRIGKLSPDTRRVRDSIINPDTAQRDIALMIEGDRYVMPLLQGFGLRRPQVAAAVDADVRAAEEATRARLDRMRERVRNPNAR